jgi:5'-nucleotidase
MFRGASYEVLAANVENSSTLQTVFPPYAIRDIAGVRIAFVGMTLEGTPSITAASAVEGLTFENEVKTVNALVPEIRQKGVSAIIVLLHQGAGQASTGTYDSCDSLTGDLLPILKGDATGGTPALDPTIEVVASAHTHQAYDCTIDGHLVTSAASFGRLITKIDLTIDPDAHRIISKQARNVSVTRDVAIDPDVASIVARYEAESAPLAHRVVGHIAADLKGDRKTGGTVSGETSLGDVIADAELAATKDAQNGGAVLAFIQPGGVRADLLAKGPNKEDFTVTYEEAFAAEPFSNNLVTMTLTGAQIATLLDQQFAVGQPRILSVSSNMSFRYRWDGASGVDDPSTILVDGPPLDPHMTYRTTVTSFLAGGGDGFAVLKEGTDQLSGMIDLDALLAYLGQTTAALPLQPPPPSRVQGNGCPHAP